MPLNFSADEKNRDDVNRSLLDENPLSKMMSHPLFFLCPFCKSEESIRHSRCRSCGTVIKIKREELCFDGRKWSSEYYENWLAQNLSPRLSEDKLKSRFAALGLTGTDSDLLRISGRATLRQGVKTVRFRGYRGQFEYSLEKPVSIGDGFLLLFQETAEFRTGNRTFSWRKDQFTCITTNGHYFEFKIRHRPFFQIYFKDESPLKYELIFRKWIAGPPDTHPEGRILEFQPRIVTKEPSPARRVWTLKANLPVPQESVTEKMFMEFVRLKIRLFLKLFLKVKIIHGENWSRMNQGWVIVNHQSTLDPFIVAACFDRQVAFLTKSTSFLSRVPGIFLRWAKALPTTRYQTDPEIVRIVRKFIRRGFRIGIFPEGERSWGGGLRHFKLGTVKMMMASRLPVTPVILQNTFRFWPRWSEWPRPTRVKISVEAPFCLIPHLYSVIQQRDFLEKYYKNVLYGDQNQLIRN